MSVNTACCLSGEGWIPICHPVDRNLEYANHVTVTHSSHWKKLLDFVYSTCGCTELVLIIFLYRSYSVMCITVKKSCEVITQRRSFAEYWKYFVARFGDVHAFGYNSAGSERILIKFGELWVCCLELALTDFGRDPRRSESGRACGCFVFFVR